MTDVARSAQQAGRSTTARRVVLVGWAAKGVVYAVLAYLVLQLAFGSASQEASTTGALRTISGTGPGSVALVVVGLGLLAFAVGRVLEVTTLATPQIETKDRVQAALLALLYTSLALTALGLVVRSGSSGGGASKEQQSSSLLLGLPGGRFLVGAVGLTVVAFGVQQVRKGIGKDFLGTLRTDEMSTGLRSATDRPARRPGVRHEGSSRHAARLLLRAGAPCGTTPARRGVWTPHSARWPSRAGDAWC